MSSEWPLYNTHHARIFYVRSGPKIELSHHNPLHGSHVLITMTEYIQATVDIRAQLGTIEEGKPRHYPGRDADINGKGQRYTQCARARTICLRTDLESSEGGRSRSSNAKHANPFKRKWRAYRKACGNVMHLRTRAHTWSVLGSTGYPSFSLLVRYIWHQRLYSNNTMQIGNAPKAQCTINKQ